MRIRGSKDHYESLSLEDSCSPNEERLVRNRRLGWSNQERHGHLTGMSHKENCNPQRKSSSIARNHK